MSDDLDPRYPVGKFSPPEGPVTTEQRAQFLHQVTEAPAKLRAAIQGLTEAQLDTPYREGGWSSRQVVHHVADSHMNAFIRFKLGLCEDNPTIKPYAEALWAELMDARTMPVAVSLDILESLHARLVVLLRSIDVTAFQRLLTHPENGPMTVDGLLATYAWHGRHHVAHVTALRARMHWP